MREKIAEIIKEETSRSGIFFDSVYVRCANQVLTLITKEIKKGLLTDEEMKNCTYKISTSEKPYAFTKDDGTILDPRLYSFVDMRKLVQTQLQKILALLKE